VPEHSATFIKHRVLKSSASIHIGTSGWSYKHWRKIYYPEGLKQADWLKFYTNDFMTTEINTSFYHLPSVTTTEGWKKKVPASFMFCPKMSRYLTHMKKLNDPEESMERFFDVFIPLKRKLGPVLIQLPPSLRFNEVKATALYKLCKRKYAYYRFAMEVRHSSWLSDESIKLMKQYNMAFVISQSGTGFPYAELVTAKHIYIRFHGPEALYASSYSEEQLKDFAAMFINRKKQGHSVFAFFNNDIFGYAVQNAKRLIELCEK
jgi:uncharacterized protein YecE (DUF72 family)